MCGDALTVEIAYITSKGAEWDNHYIPCPCCVITELIGDRT